jgi:hypothetical protein
VYSERDEGDKNFTSTPLLKFARHPAERKGRMPVKNILGRNTGRVPSHFAIIIAYRLR